MPNNFSAMTDKVFEHTEKLIQKFGPRKAGSRASLDCADILYQEMAKFADETRVESFGVHAGAFLGWIRILVLLYTASTVSLWFGLPWVSAGLLGLGILIMVFQFFLYKHSIDFLYPKKPAKNVIAIVEPEEEVRQQIIISGHHDSARVFNFYIHQPKLYGLRVIGGIGILITVFILSLVMWLIKLPAPAMLVLSILATAGALIVLQLWFFASSKATPGAGDNLVASIMAQEALRQISKNKKEGNGLRYTRVIAISFDAEEEGLRGAYAYARNHKEDLTKVPTYLYNIDCPFYLNDLFFLTSDINGSVKLSQSFADECRTSANHLGYQAVTKPITFLTGGTDAAELAKVGVEATTLLAMPWDNSERASVYHTPNDTIDKVEKPVIQAGLEIFFDLLSKKDQAVTKG